MDEQRRFGPSARMDVESDRARKDRLILTRGGTQSRMTIDEMLARAWRRVAG
jgi:hypothetical protein